MLHRDSVEKVSSPILSLPGAFQKPRPSRRETPLRRVKSAAPARKITNLKGIRLIHRFILTSHLIFLTVCI
ncbi:hypothetical protein D0U02_04390 [Burkholderia pseudomallei]|uniref:Uncharacterized protein n=1 Tax=Burkholderia pseudomallei TaxID=28450 RepID=A0AAX0U5S2_BURPE|nr:conserved hypothetical protein [Burkholderia pseudomallei 668]ARK60734.1 hypothetical protein BOC37_13040 [Burkholderia pseudomallei]EXI97741.1 hypothetical protein T210_0138350 [Burkholderia pseudomallei MSHR6137]PNX06727.1 hypothetical protein CF649_00775 [Burkholderia sp. 136(2017)]PNX15570.1 hypothetical protein CF650_12555 [Burkholderia sp. 129]PNX33965.1 hypothetical protein CF647_00685 [Burkholderia sp. 117]PNX42448.1 hypothetical protein CF648_00775 [Burkholderia sp. 137]